MLTLLADADSHLEQVTTISTSRPQLSLPGNPYSNFEILKTQVLTSSMLSKSFTLPGNYRLQCFADLSLCLQGIFDRSFRHVIHFFSMH